jgi:peptidoglycan/LPS O-acetylase OafA/YrhL
MSCVGSTALLIHSFYDCGGISFNGVSWSISAEFVMYIIFPLLVYWKVKSTLVKLSAPVLLACGLLYYKFIMDGTIGTEAWTNIDGPIRALPSFLFGLALFQGREVISRIPTCRYVLFVSTLAMIFAMFAGAPAMVDIALIYIVSASAVACDVNVRPNKVSVKIASFGQITYSLYMLHGIIIMIIINAFGDKLLHLPAIPMLVLVVVCYAVIFRVAVWSYVFFETPARKWIDQIPFRRQPD